MAVNFQRNLILQKLHDRNKKQRDGYASIISLNNKLFEDAESAKAKIIEQSVEVDKLKQDNFQLQIKAESGGGGGGSSSQAVDQRLLKLQEELTEMHRNKGENAQKIIDLNNAIQEKEKELHAKDERIRALMQELEDMSAKITQQEHDNHELRTTNQILTDEQQALHLAFASLEEKFRKLQEDNNELVGRWLQFKSQAADQMNAENDQMIKKRDKAVQKQLEDAAKEQKVVKEPVPTIEIKPCGESSRECSEEESMDEGEEDEGSIPVSSVPFDHCYTKGTPSPGEQQEAAAPNTSAGSQVKQEPARFNELSEDDLLVLADGTMGRTLTATRWASRQFREWLKERGYSPEFEELPVPDLEKRLRRFYGEINGKDGKGYSKSSLIGIRSGINRSLQCPPYRRTVNITSDKEFQLANRVLFGRIKRDTAKGLNNKISKTAVTAADVARLYSSGTLSNKDPQSLQFKVFFELALTFGRRGRSGWHSLKKENLVFIKNQSNGTEFVMLNEGGDPVTNYTQLVQDRAKRMFSSPGTDNCPVKSLKLYLSKLSKKEDAFFQKVRRGIDIKSSDEWYINKMGIHNVNGLMKRISKAANLSQEYTNYCITAKSVSTVVVLQQPCV